MEIGVPEREITIQPVTIPVPGQPLDEPQPAPAKTPIEQPSEVDV